jgi:hypothetical protein
VPDRDLAQRLAKVELGELAGAVDGALEASRRRQEAGAELAQAVVEDRLAAPITERLDLLEDPDARERRLVGEQLADRRHERVDLRGALRARAVGGRLGAAKRGADRVSRVAGAPCDLLDRQALDRLHRPDLGPLLHANHPLPPGLDR